MSQDARYKSLRDPLNMKIYTFRYYVYVMQLQIYRIKLKIEYWVLAPQEKGRQKFADYVEYQNMKFRA